jgi:truncated hemoglobin YjbI
MHRPAAAVFRAAAEPFVDPHGATPAEIAAVVAGCPSGALACARGSDGDPVEISAEPSITPIVDGPYRVRGAIQVVGADAHPPSLYAWAGGIAVFERLMSLFYDAILSEPDPILEPVLRGIGGTHSRHVAAWLAETFGGPTTYTDELGGYKHMLAKHRNLALTETQRRRWIARMMDAADHVGLPTDPGFRSTFVAYLEWGTRIAVINSQPRRRRRRARPDPSLGLGPDATVPAPTVGRPTRRRARSNVTPSNRVASFDTHRKRRRGSRRDPR